MKKLLIATKNKGKLKMFQNLLVGLDIELFTLDDLNIEIEIEEGDISVFENAKKKAVEYYKIAKIPTLSMDSGLYFKCFSKEDIRQPGAMVRRVDGKYLTDDEMIIHYSMLAESNGGQLEAYYEDINYLVDDNGQHHFLYINENDEDELSFTLVDKPCEKRVNGLPLKSLQFDTHLNKYYLELEQSIITEQSVKGFEKR